MPNVPDFEGAEFCDNSNAVFTIESLPKKMIVVGGGYIGVEMAQIFTGFGVDVTLLVRSEVLRGMIDDDIREVWKSNADRLGLKVVYGYVPKKVELSQNGDHKYKMTINDDKESILDGDFIL